MLEEFESDSMIIEEEEEEEEKEEDTSISIEYEEDEFWVDYTFPFKDISFFDLTP